METYYIEIPDTEDENLRKDIRSLNELLNKVGVVFETGTAYGQTLIIKIDENKLHTVSGRRAGRLRIQTEKTVSEVFRYRLNHTVHETAAYCGVSTATMNRRIASMKKKGLWSIGCDDFWTIDD